ncbi:TetR/AcrR family transcriptional regulator [Sphingopyxis sp. JAI128]|uniref:TetR/AcrR family transcriptional regulator n=1 Tax=Sphingopyxis sp. JAI128 TaxID=2723066 RepID=UPI001617482E|nr:TetR/AcrR family transcriptional regulator [Sphingopyxis sp. JAI128]MBB6426716.1 AcrR family transcriptional regulator [Sphingopyxis sp. JAI128]
MLDTPNASRTQEGDKAQPRRRRSQAERTEETRRRAIDAAIRCLSRDGYTATTTIRVAEEAKISRGGMLHHFPTKTDLIVAVAEDVSRRLHEQRKARLMEVQSGIERFRALTGATWETSQGAEEMTLLEIMMASRGDAELAGRLPDVAQRLDDYQYDGTLRIAKSAGITTEPLVKAMHTLHQAAMRGLAIELLFAKDRADVEAAYDLLRWYKDRVIERMQAESAG